MIIARYENDQLVLAHYQDMFPHVSFSSNGPNDDWFIQNDCYEVSYTKNYDLETQELTSCEPYLENGIIYTVQVTDKPPVIDESSANT
jgi:hypothetical protein